MSPFVVVDGSASAVDAAAKTASLAAETLDATPAIVAPTLRKSRRVVFIFESRPRLMAETPQAAEEGALDDGSYHGLPLPLAYSPRYISSSFSIPIPNLSPLATSC